MNRLIFLLASLALCGAFIFGATTVLADEGSDDNAQCQSTDDHGGDRAVTTDDRHGTEGEGQQMQLLFQGTELLLEGGLKHDDELEPE